MEQAIHDEREAAREGGRRRRPRGAVNPRLWFSGTPRGSFGLEFTAQQVGDDTTLEGHGRSLENVAKAIISIAERESESFDEIIEGIPPRVLQPLKQFVAILAQHEAEIRLAFHDRPGRSLSVAQIARAATRLDRDVRQDSINIEGVFRGVTFDSGNFDLRTGDNEVITGIVADHLADDDLERFNQLTNRPCVAELQKTTVSKVSGHTVTKYILLDARPTPAKLQDAAGCGG